MITLLLDCTVGEIVITNFDAFQQGLVIVRLSVLFYSIMFGGYGKNHP